MIERVGTYCFFSSSCQPDDKSLQTKLLFRGGFHLRKLTSNSTQMLKKFSMEHLEKPIVFSPFEYPVVKILDPVSDSFTYHVQAFEANQFFRIYKYIVVHGHERGVWPARPQNNQINLKIV